MSTRLSIINTSARTGKLSAYTMVDRKISLQIHMPYRKANGVCHRSS
jgi:hypothetical protein